MDDELTRIAKAVADRIEELKGVKTQSEIAREAGFKNVNIITMIKQGSFKVPLDRAPALAAALDVDQRAFVLLAMEQFYSPKFIKELTNILCDTPK